MKKFKLYDLRINISLLAGWLIISLVKLDYSFVYGYFIVGSWQLISMMVHYYNNWFIEKGTGRLIYQRAILCLFIATGLGLLVMPLLYIILCILLFTAPFMALFYTWLCYRELYVKMQRPLAMLK